MPRTLEDYRVELDFYAGPLDLLLHLVKRHEIDLNDIPITRLTEQYIEHLRVIEEIDVDLAGEFLVMAATLLEIKSQMLVPRPEAAEGEQIAAMTTENPLDPRYELVRQLLAYKRFKDAANGLEHRRQEWESRFARAGASAPARKSLAEFEAEGETDNAAPAEIDLEDVHVLDLCAAFSRILDSIGQNKSHQVTYDDTPIALHAEDIVDRLQRDAPGGAMTLQAIFIGRKSRSELIGLFLATLELVRQRRVRVIQDRAIGEIKIELRPEADQAMVEDKATDWRDPKTGEMQYEWPSEDARARAERRSKLRASYIARKKAGETVPEEEVIDVDEEREDAVNEDGEEEEI